MKIRGIRPLAEFEARSFNNVPSTFNHFTSEEAGKELRRFDGSMNHLHV